MRVLLVLIIALALASPAAAQPEDGPTVARFGNVELFVYDEDEPGRFCDGFKVDGEIRRSGCGPVPTPGDRLDARIGTVESGERSFSGGVVTADTATVELEVARGARVRGATVSGAGYTGRYQGKLAFFLVETTAAVTETSEEPVLLRRFDAQGKLIGAAAGGHEGPTVGGPVTLLRRGPIRVSALARREFSPSVIEIDRTERRVCLDVAHHRGSSGGSCARPGPFQPPLSLQADPQCGRYGTIVSGFTRADVAQVVLTLGSGRRLRVATQDLAALTPAVRGVATLAPVGEAVRHARAFDAAGRFIDRQALGAAPSARKCPRGFGISSTLSFASFPFGEADRAAPAEGQQVVAQGPLGSRLLAREEGEYLCLGVDRLAADRRDCSVPQPQGFFADTFVHAGAATTGVGGTLPEGAAAVRVEFDDRERVTAAISDGGEYTGRYRGHLRFFLAEAPGRRRVTEIVTLDPAGRVLSIFPGPDAAPLRPSVFFRGRGFRISGAAYDFRFKFPGDALERERGTCVALTLGRERPTHEHCSPLDHESLVGRVACAPRLGVLLGKLTKGLLGVRVRLAGGSSLASRTIRVPRRFGGGRLWVLAVPARAKIVRLRFLGRRPRSRFDPRPRPAGAYSVAAPSRQCGYGLPEPTF